MNGLDVIVSLNQRVGRGVFYPVPGARVGVALFCGLSGSANQPVGVFDELALYCQSAGIATLCYELREPSRFVPTVLDLRAVAAALAERGVERMVFVVESASDRAAAFAPIAYRSVVGLVGKVVGVATILNATADDPPARRRFLPPDLRFLYRLARSHSGADGFLHEMARPGGLTELLFAPRVEQARSASAIIEPIYAWCQRALLLRESAAPSSRSGEVSPFAPEDLDEADAKQTLADLAALAEPSTVPDSGSLPESVSLLTEAREWLAEEWRRIVAEQARREPQSVPPHHQSVPTEVAILRSLDVVRRSTVGWPYLDGVARHEWLAAVMTAARVVCNHADVTAHFEPTHHSA